MRSFALIALGVFAAAGLSAQSLAEHAAAAAGATAGTAAGKPIGTAMGKIFGNVNNETAKAAAAKKDKPGPTKVVKPDLEPTLHPNGAIEQATFGPSGGEAPPARRVTRRREAPVAAAVPPVVPEVPAAPVFIEPPAKQPTAQDFATVKVGQTNDQLSDALGAPESRVSIPDDDGHMIEICDYWSHGQPLGRVRLDNGKVVSVARSGGN